MINSTHGVFGGVFKIWGLILKFWKASVLACDQQINRSEPLAVGKVFQNMRINPHFLKNFFFFFCKESALYIHAYELKCELLLVLVMMTISEWVADWSGMVKIWNCTVEKASRQVPGGQVAVEESNRIHFARFWCGKDTISRTVMKLNSIQFCWWQSRWYF